MRDTDLNQFDLDQYIPYLLNRAGSLEAQAFTQLLARHNISISAWRILAALHQEDNQRMGELSHSTSIEVSTLSRSVAALQKQGLVKRKRSASDARVVSVALTDKGREATNAIIPEAIAHETLPLAGFSDRDRKTLIALLQRLYENLIQSENLPAPSEAPADDRAISPS